MCNFETSNGKFLSFIKTIILMKIMPFFAVGIAVENHSTAKITPIKSGFCRFANSRPVRHNFRNPVKSDF